MLEDIQMNALLKEEGFETTKDLFEYIEETHINGNITHAKDLVFRMPVEYRLRFLQHLVVQDSSYAEYFEKITKPMLTYYKNKTS